MKNLKTYWNGFNFNHWRNNPHIFCVPFNTFFWEKLHANQYATCHLGLRKRSLFDNHCTCCNRTIIILRSKQTTSFFVKTAILKISKFYREKRADAFFKVWGQDPSENLLFKWYTPNLLIINCNLPSDVVLKSLILFVRGICCINSIWKQNFAWWLIWVRVSMFN